MGRELGYYEIAHTLWHPFMLYSSNQFLTTVVMAASLSKSFYMTEAYTGDGAVKEYLMSLLTMFILIRYMFFATMPGTTLSLVPFFVRYWD
jgi:hypothetical protein